jgi:hypothetical protein
MTKTSAKRTRQRRSARNLSKASQHRIHSFRMNEASAICSPPLVDLVVGDTFDLPAAQAGFAKISARRYVRQRFTGVRDVVELRSDRATLILVWGFSFDFVPHIAGRFTETVRWHRTNKSATPDLRYSGLGRFCSGPREPGATIQLWQGESRLRQEAELSKFRLLPRALATLDSIRNLHGFRQLFEFEAREKHFFNFPQVVLGYAFYLAKIGDEGEARRYMSEWLQRSNHREATQKTLARLFEEAAASPLTLQ